MSRKLDFSEAEEGTGADFSNIGTYARDDAQAIIGGAIAAPNQWSRFSWSQPNNVTINVLTGMLFVDDTRYDIDDNYPQVVDLRPWLPLGVGNQKYVALLARGVSTNLQEIRQFETDADSGEAVSISTPKTDLLYVTIDVAGGTESPTPLLPTVGDGQCCIAYVLLGISGVISIEAATGWKLMTLYDAAGMITILQQQMADIAQRTASLETDVANIAAALKTIPRPELIQQMETNLATLNTALKVPSSARAYVEDPGLFSTNWDTTNANWLARIWTGVRFPWATIVNNQLSLLTAGDPLTKTVNNLMLPAWTEKTRISVEGNDGYKDISDQVHTVTTAVQGTLSRTSVSYGPTINVCQNQIGFAAVAGTEVGQTFTANGQTYVSDGLSTSTTPYAPGLDSPAQWNADPNSAGHQIYAVQQLQVDSWTETYWYYVTNSYGVNGSIYGQTFLNAQPMVATSVDLFFARCDTTGDVNLFLAELPATGQPSFDNVLAQATVAASSLPANASTKNPVLVNFAITPTLLQSGKRYVWWVVTNGNHALAYVKNNKYAQGSMFWCTDGVWAQGDNTEDFAFHVNAASFSTTRATVNMQPITVSGGMTELRLLYAGFCPPGCQLVWEILPVGATTWSMLVPSGNNNPLYGLPALCQLRVNFVGTTDLMPAIVMDTNARIWGGRMGPTLTAPLKQQTFGFSSSSITVVTTVDNYYPATHTFVQKLILHDGTTIITPSSVTQAIDPNDSTRYTFTSVFAPGTAQASAAPMPTMTTSNVQVVPFVQDIVLLAA